MSTVERSTGIKQTVDGTWHAQVHAALRAELLGFVALFGGEDYRETQARPHRQAGT